MRTMIERGFSRVSPFYITSALPNMPACQVAIQFGLHGYNTTIATACAASSQAIGEAAEVNDPLLQPVEGNRHATRLGAEDVRTERRTCGTLNRNDLLDVPVGAGGADDGRGVAVAADDPGFGEQGFLPLGP